MDFLKRIVNNSIFLLLATGIIILISWLLSWYFIDYTIDISDRGTFGDKFGAINSLFSGFAFAGIIVSLYYQKKEMKLQRDDLELQRDEMRETREEFVQQNFQTAFFNLLKTHQDILAGISIKINVLESYDREISLLREKRYFFIQSSDELSKIYISLNYSKYTTYNIYDDLDQIPQPRNKEEEEDISSHCKKGYVNSAYNIDKRIVDRYKSLSVEDGMKVIYWKYFEKYGFIIGHYFRHIYHILKYIERIENIKLSSTSDTAERSAIKEEIRHYIDMFQAQMSSPELLLLFYNSLIFPKLKKLVIKYNILENLQSRQLLDSSHDCIDGIVLKKDNDILDIEDILK